MFELVVLLLISHMRGSTGTHHLRSRLFFFFFFFFLSAYIFLFHLFLCMLNFLGIATRKCFHFEGVLHFYSLCIYIYIERGLFTFFHFCKCLCNFTFSIFPLLSFSGYLKDVTGNVNATFYMGGAMLTLSGILSLPLNRLKHWQEQRNKASPEEVPINDTVKTESPSDSGVSVTWWGYILSIIAPLHMWYIHICI